MKLKALALAAALMLAACAPTTPAAPVETNPAVASCTQQGGKMQQVGRAQTWRCILSYADAAKPCSDGSQCQGDCLAIDGEAKSPAVGQCAADSNTFGCRARITGGVAEPMRCVD